MKKVKSHLCFSGVTEFFEHDSEVTKTTMKFSVHRPQDKSQIKGGLIWLSGLTCTEQNFITKAGVQSLLQGTGLVVICPDTSPRGLDLPKEHESYDFGSGAGFYVDAQTEGYKDHYRMYSYINQELYSLVNKEFGLNGRVGIFGHSMGGHGALTIGLKNPKKYLSISAFSPIVNPMDCQWGQKAFAGYFGSDQELWKGHDSCHLVATGHKHAQTILIDQGKADEFYPEQLLTENLESACSSAGQALQVNYREGYDHSYYFVSTFLQDHINHHSNHLIE